MICNAVHITNAHYSVRLKVYDMCVHQISISPRMRFCRKKGVFYGFPIVNWCQVFMTDPIQADKIQSWNKCDAPKKGNILGKRIEISHGKKGKNSQERNRKYCRQRNRKCFWPKRKIFLGKEWKRASGILTESTISAEVWSDDSRKIYQEKRRKKKMGQ